MTKPNLGRYGVMGFYSQFAGMSAQQLRDIEALGYGALWAGGPPPADLKWAEPILGATDTLQLATTVINVWAAEPGPVSESFQRIEAAYPGRFVLGIGVGHPEAHAEYKKPVAALTEYLDKLDEYGVPADRRVIAALGPKVLTLSADRSAGAHPLLTTPEHTAKARQIIGADAFLAPAQVAVLTTDVERARAIGRTSLDFYLGMQNYRNNWRRLGFTDDDLARPGSDRFVDALVAHGTQDEVAARLKQHLDAGADHVPVGINEADKLVSALADLAEPLGLQ